MTISDGILSITASTTSRRHRWTNMMIYQNDRGNTIPLLQDVLLLCKISHYHTLSTLVSPAKTFVSLVNQPCDHGSKWAGLGWSQMGNTLQWKITLFFFEKKKHADFRVQYFAIPNIVLRIQAHKNSHPKSFQIPLKMTRETSVITGSHAHSHGMRSRAKRCASQSISSSAFTEVSYRSLPVTKIIW